MRDSGRTGHHLHDVPSVAAVRGQIRGQAPCQIANFTVRRNIIPFRCQRLDTARRTRLTRTTGIRLARAAHFTRRTGLAG